MTAAGAIEWWSMSHWIVRLACAAMLLGAAPVAADVLRGHLSGFDPEFVRVDLRVRFYDAAGANDALAERRFNGVALMAGDFSIPFDPFDLPGSARFVEVALRPSARRYAAYRAIPPRQRLERPADDILVAGMGPSLEFAPSVFLYHGDLE